MSNEANTEYLNSIRERYKKANRKEKSDLIRHVMLVTGLSKSRIIHRLNEKGENLLLQKRGRRPKYGPELLEPIKSLWMLMEQPCGKKMKVLLLKLLPAYQKRNPEISEAIVTQLQEISAATLERYLKALRVKKGMSLTKPPTSSWYKSAIPVQAKDWNITSPGFIQADTVSHCGESAHGTFASTLTMTDLDSHWTELRATWTKQHKYTIRAIRDSEKAFPFAIDTIKFDSGSEFMNYDVMSFCMSYGPSYQREKPIKVVRTRPYRKNDNCYVEQKNLTHVRQFIGYERIDSQSATEILNEIYRDLWCPFLNFFMPTFKLLRKERIGSRIVKKYEEPKTPYDRLMYGQTLNEEQKLQLKAKYESLDPFEMKLQLEEKLKLFYRVLREETQARKNEALKNTA